MNIELHIERLVLDGFEMSHPDRRVLMAAVEAELARLLASQALPSALATAHALPVLRTPSVALPVGQTQPVQLGESIAGAVHASLGMKQEVL